MFGRKRQRQDNEDEYVTEDYQPSTAQVKRATRARWIWALITAFLLLLSVIFTILVEVGSTENKHILTRIYFIRLDLSNVVPYSVPDATLINSIARTLGLHDFYTVGLWNFCEGYNGLGYTDCSNPRALYWFNPVAIIQSELLSGAEIALPKDINKYLKILRIASQWMFGLFLTGACLSFIMMFVVLTSVFSRWTTLATMLLTFLSALCTTVAAVLATAMFLIIQRVLTSATQLNIGAKVGTEMFVFMWIAAGTAILAWIIQMGMCCCCASRRDVKKGKKRGSKKAWEQEKPVARGETDGEAHTSD